MPKIQINFCKVEELLQIPGIGRALADRILALREASDITAESLVEIPHIRNPSEIIEHFDFAPFTERLSVSDDRSPSRDDPTPEASKLPSPYPYDAYPKDALPSHIVKPTEGEESQSKVSEDNPREKAEAIDRETSPQPKAVSFDSPKKYKSSTRERVSPVSSPDRKDRKDSRRDDDDEGLYSDSPPRRSRQGRDQYESRGETDRRLPSIV